jgi:formylglycine-generating enzyme required for sulfatase activity
MNDINNISSRVVRGGAFGYNAGGVRCAYRGRDYPLYRDLGIGFRVVFVDSDYVLRGGSWVTQANGCRCASRLRGRPDGWYDGVGFRCAKINNQQPCQD